MAAAAFFAEDEFETEEQMEAEAEHIGERTLLLQANIRGYLSRRRQLFRTDPRHSVHDGQTDAILQSTCHTQKSVRGLEITKTDPGDAQMTDLWEIEFHHKEINSDHKLPVSTGNPSSFTVASESFEYKHAQAAKGQAQYGNAPAAPWWIEVPLEHESKALCAICSHISFDTLLHSTDPYMYEPPISLGNIRSISIKTGCSFCRLLAHSASILLETSLESLRYDTAACAIDCHLCDDPDWARCKTRIRQICLRLTLPLPVQRSLPGQTRTVQIFGRFQQILQNNERPPEQKFNDVRLVNDLIDLDLIKSWIRVCEAEHSSTQLLSNDWLTSLSPSEVVDIHSPSALIIESCQPRKLNETAFCLTVVDVRKECLVDVLPEVRYVALSYVWGGPQTFQNVLKTRQSLYLPHSISLNDEAIPYTIRDAIRLVALVGENYLWVDSLCICQDDLDSKMKQINNVGNIYSQAMLTIVAAYGKTAHAGLPGVRPSSRKSVQHTEVVQNMLLANEIHHLDQELLDAYWNDRGWTYQEKELSNRCIIFGEAQVYFQCNRKEFKEDSGLRDVANGNSRALRIRGENHPIWNSYRRAVESFTKRNLTFDSDVIHAFQGVASLFQPAFKGEFLFGLPETELDAALLWQPYSSTRRRIGGKAGSPSFPSWSWAGWVGTVRYRWSKHLLDNLSRVEWRYTDSAQGQIGFCNSSDLRAPKNGTHSTWEYVRHRDSSYYYQSGTPSLWCSHPTASKDERRDRILIRPGDHCLTFKAYVATFDISTTHTNFSFDPAASCRPDAHVLCPIRILDRDGFAAGTIYLPGQASTMPSNQKHEFVCLSRRRSEKDLQYSAPPAAAGDDGDSKDVPGHVTIYPVKKAVAARMPYDPRRYNMNKPWQLYNVMLIRREKDVAYRVAIGLMHVTAFWQARPVKKLITLA